MVRKFGAENCTIVGDMSRFGNVEFLVHHSHKPNRKEKCYQIVKSGWFAHSPTLGSHAPKDGDSGSEHNSE